MDVKEQLQAFAAAKLKPQLFPPAPQQILLLPIGERACATQNIFREKLRNSFHLADNFITTCEIPECEPDAWNKDRIRSINELADQAARQFAVMRCQKVLCAIVWADDLLADKAPDLLNLFHNWIGLNGGNANACRCMLLMITPRWNMLRADRLNAAFGAKSKLTDAKYDPVLCMHYSDEDSHLTPPAPAINMEAYFLECQDDGSTESCLENCACLLGGAPQSRGLYIPAFRETDCSCQNILTRQALACLTQLEDDTQDKPADRQPQSSIIDIIRGYVETAEAPMDDYRAWMRHARVFRQDPAVPGNLGNRLYGTWLEDLSNEWCRRLSALDLPDQKLSEWLQDCTLPQLEIWQNQLVNFGRKTAAREERGSFAETCTTWTGWKDYLDYQVEYTYVRKYRKAIEDRTHSLVQRMLTLVNDKLTRNGTRTINWPELRRNLEQIQAETYRLLSFTPAVMDADQCVRFEQIVHQILSETEPDYRNMFNFLHELILGQIAADEISLDTWLKQQTDFTQLCPYNYALSVNSKYLECYTIPNGSRSGQVLYALPLRENDGVPVSSLLFYCNNAVRIQENP